ncbi:MAG: hypothetical protein E5V34_04865, partial [Mesorhizobium sp.]
DMLEKLAGAADLEGRRAAMFSGRKINVTEGRAVLHTALRNLNGKGIVLDGQDVKAEVVAVGGGEFFEALRISGESLAHAARFGRTMIAQGVELFLKGRLIHCLTPSLEMPTYQTGCFRRVSSRPNYLAEINWFQCAAMTHGVMPGMTRCVRPR